MNTNPSNSTDPSQGAGNGTPPAQGANPQLHGNKDTSIEELQRQLAKAQADNADFLADNLKYRERQRKQEEADKAKEAQDKAAQEKLLQEQNQFKELAEKRQADVLKLQEEIAQRDSEIAKRDYEALRSKVALKHSLAPELAIRLVGTTEEELNADAAQLKKITGESRATLPGNAPNPRPTSAEPSRQEQKQNFREERVKRGMYSL